MTSNPDDLLRRAAETGDVPGVVAMAANHSGVIYSGAFGRRSLPHGAPMTSDTVFLFASMTKAITSTAAALLVEQGKLTLDDPIQNVLPELATPPSAGGLFCGGQTKIASGETAYHSAPAADPYLGIRLRHLES